MSLTYSNKIDNINWTDIFYGSPIFVRLFNVAMYRGICNRIKYLSFKH